MHAFKVGQHDLPVEGVPMLGPSVLDNGIGHVVLVIANEISTAAWTRLFEHHQQSCIALVSSRAPGTALVQGGRLESRMLP